MPGVDKHFNQRRIQLLFGLSLAVILYAEFQLHDGHDPVLNMGGPVVLAAENVDADPFEKLIRRDPLAAFKAIKERHLREVRDYTCTFVKQELLPSGMSAEQEIRVKFRQEPFSVTMQWVRNPGLANRVIYVEGRWIDRDAKNPDRRELAVCQPGAALQLLLKSIKQPIHGPMARKTARRFIDEFGFGRTLDLLIKYGDLAASRGELDLEFRGETHFDGRPVWVVRRHLPYTGEDGLYPDRTAEIYIDQQYRVPVAVYCYSDDQMRPQNLLGKYEYRDIRFDQGLTEADFDPATYGM